MLYSMPSCLYQSKKIKKYIVIAVKVRRVTLNRGLCRIQATEITKSPIDLPIKMQNIAELKISWILNRWDKRLTKRMLSLRNRIDRKMPSDASEMVISLSHRLLPL